MGKDDRWVFVGPIIWVESLSVTLICESGMDILFLLPFCLLLKELLSALFCDGGFGLPLLHLCIRGDMDIYGHMF